MKTDQQMLDDLIDTLQRFVKNNNVSWKEGDQDYGDFLLKIGLLKKAGPNAANWEEDRMRIGKFAASIQPKAKLLEFKAHVLSPGNNLVVGINTWMAKIQ